MNEYNSKDPQGRSAKDNIWGQILKKFWLSRHTFTFSPTSRQLQLKINMKVKVQVKVLSLRRFKQVSWGIAHFVCDSVSQCISFVVGALHSCESSDAVAAASSKTSWPLILPSDWACNSCCQLSCVCASRTQLLCSRQPRFLTNDWDQ